MNFPTQIRNKSNNQQTPKTASTVFLKVVDVAFTVIIGLFKVLFALTIGLFIAILFSRK